MTRMLIVVTLGACMIGSMIGCETGPIVEGGAETLPQPLYIALRQIEPGGRSAYYILDEKGQLHFGGGRLALAGATNPAGQLNDEQRMQAWRLVLDYQLLDADGSFFASGERIRYEAELRAGSQRNRFTTVDDRVAGLADLSDLLFQFQSELRYGRVLDAVESKIESRGGNVPKQ